MSDWEPHCSLLGKLYFSRISPILSCLAAVVTIPIFYVHIQAIKTKQCRNCACFINCCFFAVSFLHFVFNVFYGVTLCDNWELSVLAFNVSVLTFTVQWCMLLGIFYHRLDAIFKDTDLQLSKCAVRSFWAYYIFVIVFGVFSSLALTNVSISTGAYLIAVAGVLFLCLILILAVSFLYKLYKTHKCAEQSGMGLKAIITKTSLLTFISILTALLHLCMTVLETTAIINSIHWSFIRSILGVVDSFTNFACVFLSFTEFKSYYMCLCACCDNACHSCWSRCVQSGQHDAANMVKMQTMDSLEIATPRSNSGFSSTSGEQNQSASSPPSI